MSLHKSSYQIKLKTAKFVPTEFEFGQQFFQFFRVGFRVEREVTVTVELRWCLVQLGRTRKEFQFELNCHVELFVVIVAVFVRDGQAVAPICCNESGAAMVCGGAVANANAEHVDPLV